MEARATVHQHCHQSSVVEDDEQPQLLRAMGLEVNLLDSGCCGMAGEFGYEKSKYPLSVQLAQRRLLPAIDQLQDGELLVADGFSCREQIRQLSGQRALHTAEVLRRGLGLGDTPQKP